MELGREMVWKSSDKSVMEDVKMSDFYDMYSEDGLDIYEGDKTSDYHAIDSFMVDDMAEDEYLSDDPMTLEVSEDEPGDLAEDNYMDTVPGSDKEFVTYNPDDTMEVREKNWEKDKDSSKFIQYLEDALTKIPRHSGKTIPGCERATAYVKDLDNQAGKAMRSDYSGDIDEEALDKIRQDMQKMVDRLENHIERLQKNAGEQKVRFISEGVCKKCNSNAPVWHDVGNETSVCISCDTNESDSIEKTAGLPVLKVFMTPFERAVVGTIINSKVSGGRNIEETYEKLKSKYNFTPREELSFQQLIADHGYPVYRDRGLINEPTDPSSGDNVEWQTNYYA